MTAEAGSDFTYVTAGRQLTEFFQEESSECKSSETEPCWQNELAKKRGKNNDVITQHNGKTTHKRKA